MTRPAVVLNATVLPLRSAPDDWRLLYTFHSQRAIQKPVWRRAKEGAQGPGAITAFRKERMRRAGQAVVVVQSHPVKT